MGVQNQRLGNSGATVMGRGFGRLGVFAVLAIASAIPPMVSAQALTSLASLRVSYNTRKNTMKPAGELKAQLDAVDAALAEAGRLGRTGETRRLLAKGMALLAGRPWNDTADYGASLLLRAPRVVADSTLPLTVRLEQLYEPQIALERPLRAHVVLRQRPTGPPQAGAVGAPVKDLGSFDGVARDLRESPLWLDLSVGDVADGGYVIAVDVLDGERTLGSTMLMVALRKGLDAQTARLVDGARTAPEGVRDDILFPVDRMRNVNRGRLELRTFDVDRDLAEAEAVLTAVRAGRDPFAGRTGDMERHYRLDMADEIMPYRLYVPSSYKRGTPMPLIVALHGLGGTEDAFFTGYNADLPRLAEQRGYIVAAPLGYRVDGSYGWGLGTAPADPNVRRVQAASEEDVMQVLAKVREHYSVDASRTYLLGHSMGAIGAWKIAAKFPEPWAAVAPIAGSGAPATVARMSHIPQIVVHGDADPTVSVEGSRAMVAEMKKLGMVVTYIEVPGGLHSDVVAPAFPAILDFFAKHRRAARASQ